MLQILFKGEYNSSAKCNQENTVVATFTSVVLRDYKNVSKWEIFIKYNQLNPFYLQIHL